MEKQYTNDEIDLGFLFKKIKEGYYGMLIGLYGLSKTLIKLWYIVAILIVAGIALGYITERYGKKEYESSLVVQIKQKSTAYIYDQIKYINKSLNNEAFLAKHDLKKEEIISFEMEAIPDFSEVLDDYENQNTNVIEYLLDNASAEDILRSEFFRTSYRFHKIEVVFGEEHNEQTVNKLIAVLNSNKKYGEVTKFYDEFYPQKVQELTKMKIQIDSIIANYTTSKKARDPISNIYIGEESENLPRLIEYKTYLLRFLEEANYDAIFGKEKVNLVNEVPIVKKTLFLRPLILYPLLLFAFFLLIIRLLKTHKKAKRLYLDYKS